MMTHVGFHEPTFVVLSILIAAIASYTSLDLASRMRVAEGLPRFLWLMTAAIVMGGGIWAMHFVAMLAFVIHDVTISYDPLLTLFSLLLPIAVTAIAFAAIGRLHSTSKELAVGGLVMGLGVAAMHYTGMAAMRMPVHVGYSAFWVATSVLVAVGAATAALWIAARDTSMVQRSGASIVMGIAIAGMHYSAMQGLTFTHKDASDAGSSSVAQEHLATWVTAATLVILLMAIVAAAIDRQIASRSAREAARLRQSEERFRLLLESLTDYAIIMLDPQGHVTNWNAGAERIKGYTETDVIGRHFSIFYIDEDQAAGLPHEALQTASSAGRFEHVGWRRRKDGTSFWANVIISPIRDADGTLLGFAKITRDLTEQRQTEEALEKTRQALFQAQKMEAVGQLTGGVAHDFNNLLMAVMSSLEMLVKRLPSDERLHRLGENAMKGAQRGVALTQRMLAFARRQDLNPTAVNIPDLIANMRDLFERSVDPSTEIVTQFPLKLPPALVDNHQLELALLNLVVNARDAMPEGGRIIISAEVRSSPDLKTADRYVCISVADTGCGMDQATLSRALDPFFTTKGVGKGTGLGLPMVHGVAEQSGGTLKLRSAVGEGTTAEIWLPVAERVAPAAPPVEPERDEPKPALRKLRILVVDDDPLVLESTCEMLKENGHDIVAARSGLEALRALDAYPLIDLVISDQGMPGMSGLELLGEIARRKPGVRRIIASGFAELPASHAALAVRLAKPFDLTRLSAAIAAAAQDDNVIEFTARTGR